jgi:hypothetical protein
MTTRRLALRAPVLLALSVAAAACGGGGGGDASADAGAACPVVAYAACGGALEGTWTFDGLCPEAPADVPCEGPYDDPACQGGGNQAHCALSATGSMTFTATDVHVVRDLYADATYVFTPECLAAVKPGVTPESACTLMSNPSRGLACSFADGACTCAGRAGPEPSDDTVPYTVTGANLVLGDEEPMAATYCVADGRLTIDFDPHPQSWRYWVLDRQ